MSQSHLVSILYHLQTCLEDMSQSQSHLVSILYYTILPANMVRRHVSVSPGLYTILPANVVRRYVSVSVSPGLCPPGRVWDSSLHPPVVESSEPSQTTPATQNMKYPHIDHGQTVKTSVNVMTWVLWRHVTLMTWVLWRHVTLVTWVLWRHVTLMTWVSWRHVTLVTWVLWRHVTLVTWVSWRRAQCFLIIGKFCARNCSFLRNHDYFGTYWVKLIDQNVYVSHLNLQRTIMYYKITKCWIPEQFVPEECK